MAWKTLIGSLVGRLCARPRDNNRPLPRIERVESRRLMSVSIGASAGVHVAGTIGPVQAVDATATSFGVHPTAIHATHGQSQDVKVGWITYDVPKGTQLGVTIEWGDGTTSDGRLVKNKVGGYNIMSRHVYSSAGNFTVRAVVTGQQRRIPGQVSHPSLFVVVDFNTRATVG